MKTCKHKKNAEENVAVPFTTEQVIQQLKDEINILKDKLNNQINVTNNIHNNIHNNIQNNIHVGTSEPEKLREFGCENLSAVPEEFIGSCFITLQYKDLLENLHYDPEFPENNNVRIKSVKRNMMEIYKNNRWNVVTLKNGLEELIKQGTLIFQKYARGNEHKILEEDMTRDELEDIMDKLQQISNMHSKYIKSMSQDIQAMLESQKTPNWSLSALQ
jgi:arsenate reductase-like glutaredoxin family protein